MEAGERPPPPPPAGGKQDWWDLGKVHASSSSGIKAAPRGLHRSTLRTTSLRREASWGKRPPGDVSLSPFLLTDSPAINQLFLLYCFSLTKSNLFIYFTIKRNLFFAMARPGLKTFLTSFWERKNPPLCGGLRSGPASLTGLSHPGPLFSWRVEILSLLPKTQFSVDSKPPAQAPFASMSLPLLGLENSHLDLIPQLKRLGCRILPPYQAVHTAPSSLLRCNHTFL